MMQTLFKNLFNSINTSKISLFVIFTKIFRELFVKGKSRYRKIDFFTTSASLKCIIWLKQFVVPPPEADRESFFRIQTSRKDSGQARMTNKITFAAFSGLFLHRENDNVS